MLVVITSDGLFSNANIDDLERPYTLKIGSFSVFLQFLAVAHISRVNCTRMAKTTCEQELLRLSRVS